MSPARGRRKAAQPTERVSRAVLGAAHDLIEEGGFFALTVDGLVDRAGVSRATLYRWWDNRAAVALDMLVQTVGEPVPLAEGESATVRIRAFLRAEVVYLDGPAGPVVAGLIADAQRRPEMAKTLEERFFAPRRTTLQDLLTAAVAEGSIRHDVDLRIVNSLLLGAIYERLVLAHAPLTDELADSILDTILAGASA